MLKFSEDLSLQIKFDSSCRALGENKKSLQPKTPRRDLPF
jgi:hypothetical protein